MAKKVLTAAQRKEREEKNRARFAKFLESRGDNVLVNLSRAYADAHDYEEQFGVARARAEFPRLLRNYLPNGYRLNPYQGQVTYDQAGVAHGIVAAKARTATQGKSEISPDNYTRPDQIFTLGGRQSEEEYLIEYERKLQEG